MQVLIADCLDPTLAQGLEALGVDVRVEPQLGPSDLARALKGVDILVVGETAVTRTALERADNLSLVVRAGDGAGAVDLVAASREAILVCHTAGHDAAARAELVLGMVLALDRGLGAEGPCHGLRSRLMGIAGDTHTAHHLARACSSLGMGVMMFNESLTPSLSLERGYLPCSSMDELLERADVLSLHPTKTEHTVPKLGPDQLARLEGRTLISLEGVDAFDVKAAHQMVVDKRLSLGIGSYDTEESEVTALATLAGVVTATPASMRTRECDTAAASEALRIIHAYLLDAPLPHTLNVLNHPEAAATLTIRHRCAHGVLAHALSVLDDEDVRVVAVHSTPFQGSEAAATFIHLDSVPTSGILERVRQRDAIFEATLVTR